jgi:small multidrug resistance pump
MTSKNGTVIPAQAGMTIHFSAPANLPMPEHPMKIVYLYLCISILAEVIATSALKSSDGFTRPLPSLVVALGYGVAFYFLSLVLKTVPMGVAYAIWSGVGMVLIAGIGWLLMKQPLDAPALLGIGLIVAGVAVIQLFSRSAAH